MTIAVSFPQAPYPVPLLVEVSSTEIDLTTATSVVITGFRQEDGTSFTWTASVQSGATTTALTAIYVVQPSDTATTLGLYSGGMTVIADSQSYPADAIQLDVQPLKVWRLNQ